MGATQGKLERVHTCVENYLQRRRRRDALDAVDAVDASRWFRPAQVETRLGRYLEDKHIWYYTSTYGIRRVKHYKVIEYDLDTKKYTVFNQDVDGPIEYIEILDEKNIEVFVETIPVEESSEEEDEDEDDEELVEKVRKMRKPALRAACTKHELWSSELVQARATVPEMKAALMKKFGLKEVSVPFTFTAEEIRKMNRAKLRAHCITYGLKRDTVPKMKEALMEKFGLEGSVLSDKFKKIEEFSNALDAFLLIPTVVAITSTISNFNPKNRDHAESFMKEYRKKHGAAEMLDPVPINGQLWLISKNNSRDGLFLQRARERREDLSPEQLQEERNRDKEEMKSRRKRRAAAGQPLRNPGAGTKKAAQARKWPFLIMLAAMCKEGFNAKAYDHLWAVAGPPPFDPKHPARCGSRCANMARAATQLTAAFAEDLFFSVIDGEGPLLGYIALYYELGFCFGKFQDPVDQLFTNLLSSRGLQKTAHRFDDGKTRKYRTPLADDRAGELQKFLARLEASLTRKGGSILGHWGGGEDKYLDAHLRDSELFTVMNLLLVIRYMLDLELNGQVPPGHPLYNCRDGVCLSTECIGPVFCGHIKQTPTFKPHHGHYDAVVTREFVAGLCAAAERARLGKADLEWNGKVLDAAAVAAVRAGWTAGEDTAYKQRLARVKRARRE